MFDNIGGKIKMLAIVMCIVSAIATLFGGIFLIAELNFAIGLIVLVGGVLLALCSAWILYGFGELIEKATEIAENTRKKDNTARAPQKKKASAVADAPKAIEFSIPKAEDSTVLKGVNEGSTNLRAFEKEIEGYSTEELLIVFRDQKDLYKAEELEIVVKELEGREDLARYLELNEL